MKKGHILYILAAVALVGAWGGSFFLDGPAVSDVWGILGWVILLLGYLFMAVAMMTLRRRGKTAAGRDFVHTRQLVTTGIFSFVRHPLYLGWMMMYLSVIFFNPHWLVILLGVFGCLVMVLITKQEDQTLRVKFGEPYQEYQETVPGLNLFIGIWRKIFTNRS